MSDEATNTVEVMNGKPLDNQTEKDIEEQIEKLTNLTELYKLKKAVVVKLVEAFNNSYNISEACQYAGISRDTYNRWEKDVPSFADLMEEAKAMPRRKAKEQVTAAIVGGDVSTARWYLERKDPEFKPKAEVDNNLGLQETRKKLGDLLDDSSADDFGQQPATATEQSSGAEVPETPTDIS